MKSSKVTGWMIKATVLLAVTLLVTGSARAAYTHWNVSSGNWGNAGNWDNGLPSDQGASDYTYIRNGGTSTVATAQTYPASLYIGDSIGGGCCILNAGASLSGANMYLNSSGNTADDTGIFTQNGGTNTVTTTLYIGQSSVVTSRYNLVNGTLNTKYQRIGYNRHAVFTQSGGTNNVSGGQLYLGDNSSSANGIYNLNGGKLWVHGGNVYIGNKGTGTVNQIAGMYTNTASLYLGNVAGAKGTYNLDDGMLYSGTEHVGEYGDGTFTQNSGSNIIKGSLYLGYRSGGVGYYEMNDGLLELPGTWHYLHVGHTAGATGTFVQVGGTVDMTSGGTAGKYFVVGSGGSHGTYRLGGGTLKAAIEIIGSDGTFIQTGAVHTVASSFTVKSNGVFRGWGTVDISSTLKNDGIIIADGYGVDRSLVMTNYSSTSHSATNGAEGTNGYYAINHGRLVLAKTAYIANSWPNYGHPYWGTDKDGPHDLVNSFDMTVDSYTQTGSIIGSLYATNHVDVPLFDKTSKVTAVWRIERAPSSSVDVQADITFRYDQVAAASLGINESDLKVYYNLGGATDSWTQVTGYSVDTANNNITASNVTDIISFFAVGDGIVDPLPPAGTTITIK